MTTMAAVPGRPELSASCLGLFPCFEFDFHFDFFFCCRFFRFFFRFFFAPFPFDFFFRFFFDGHCRIGPPWAAGGRNGAR